MAYEQLKPFFDLTPDVRYVAVHRHGSLESTARADLAGASSAESDRFEELVVNPTLLVLLTQRGNIDCGGLQYVLIRYGNFYQFVRPVPGGHVSVSLEGRCDPVALAPALERLAETL